MTEQYIVTFKRTLELKDGLLFSEIKRTLGARELSAEKEKMKNDNWIPIKEEAIT